jgi:cell division protease FtsH
MAQTLLQYETIDSEQINAIMEGRTPGPPKDWQKPTDGGLSATLNAGKPATPIGGTAAQH